MKKIGSQVTIAMDGPAGSGKSTVARRVAEKLGLLYLDSGAMYRAVTVLAIHHGLAADSSELIDQVKTCHIEFTDNGKTILLNDEDISIEIRTPPVNRLVADVAKYRKSAMRSSSINSVSVVKGVSSLRGGT